MSGEGFDEVARHLRDRVGDEFRADAEEGEREAAKAALRRRTLHDVAVDLLSRGDRVTVSVPGQRFTGTLVHVAGDLATVTGPSGTVHLRLGSGRVVMTTTGAPRRGTPSDPGGPESFKARLYELEMAERHIEVHAPPMAAGLAGKLRAVAVDHVVVRDVDGHDHFVPLDALTHVLDRSGER